VHAAAATTVARSNDVRTEMRLYTVRMRVWMAESDDTEVRVSVATKCHEAEYVD